MTNAEARFNKSLRPRKPEGSLGRTAQDVNLDSHTAPELWGGGGGGGRGGNKFRRVTNMVLSVSFAFLATVFPRRPIQWCVSSTPNGSGSTSLMTCDPSCGTSTAPSTSTCTSSRVVSSEWSYLRWWSVAEGTASPESVCTQVCVVKREQNG